MTLPISPDQHRLLTLCAIRVGGQSIDRSLLARQAMDDGGLDRLYRAAVVESSAAADKARALLKTGLDDLASAHAHVDTELALAADIGARLMTVLDDGYPDNLRLVHNLPPFLFIRGSLLERDARSVAVVGTRAATDFGRQRATQMARLLVEHGVTVVSGLAAGVDTAAHTAALDAGGRTIAVLGTGITNCYPTANRTLAERITGAGALVSQFWPSAGPARWTFPLRNVVTSGISQGTVVIEASATSGAKMQARIALEHHKRVWLLGSLVADQPWAQTYVASRGAQQISSVDEVIADLTDAEQVHATAQRRHQLTLDVL